MSSDRHIDTLQAMLGPEYVLTGSSADAYCTDQRGNYANKALAVVFPADTKQVSAVVSYCNTESIAMIPQGGNTSLSGGSVPLANHSRPQLIINLSRMNRVLQIDPENYTMIVEPGCTLADIREAAMRYNRLYPVSLSAIESRCEIGGNLSTNAGGTGVLRYGNTRDMVLGLEVVLPNGEIWNGLRSLRKDNTGYDLKHLFIGAEGTLGIITKAVLKLYPRPQSKVSACLAVSDPATAVALLAHLRSTCGDRINAFEIISRSCIELVLKHFPDTSEPFDQPRQWMVLCELADILDAPLEKALQNSLDQFPVGILHWMTSCDPDQTTAWWNLRKYISDAQKFEGKSIKHDIAVPLSKVAEFITQADAALQQAFPGIRIVAFGHIGDGNIHYNAAMPDATSNAALFAQSEAVNRIVYDIVRQLDGTISAEHGLGQLKREEIKHYKDPLELKLMQRIKHTLDPEGLMNPGKVI